MTLRSSLALSFGLVLGMFAGGALAETPKAEQLKSRLAEEIKSAPGMNDTLRKFAAEKLLPLCGNEVFVAAVVKQNGEKATLEEIRAIDDQWMKAEEELPIQTKLMSNACALEIKRIAGEHPAIMEAFVMDNQGANVGQNNLTSDYWQGDEAKWQKSFASGKGGLDVGKNQLDKSTNQSIQQVSLPIFDNDGNVIGAVCWGIAIEKL